MAVTGSDCDGATRRNLVHGIAPVREGEFRHGEGRYTVVAPIPIHR